MIRFTLTLLKDERMILSTKDGLSRDEYRGLNDAFRQWWERKGPIFLAESEVLDLRQVELELDIRDPEDPIQRIQWPPLEGPDSSDGTEPPHEDHP